jgi:hypothetical protein
MTYGVVCLCKGSLEVYEHNLMVFVFTVLFVILVRTVCLQIKKYTLYCLWGRMWKPYFWTPNWGFSLKYNEKLRIVCRDNIVGIAIHYRLGGLGIKSTWGDIFHTHPDQPWGHVANLYKGTGSFPVVKWLECVVNHALLSSVEVKKE